ncbi:MAG TPA: hypothetical protein VEW42_05910 [Candidatus Eisenbacteria bacterium]|nr:hypothetical protein [Candidatus Eisenbacteria bacterium]
MARDLQPTQGLTDDEWRSVNRSGGGKPTYTNQRVAPDGSDFVDIQHPSGALIPTRAPLSYPTVTLLTNSVPPRRVSVRVCDVLDLHGDPCARRSNDARDMRRG